MASLSDQRRLGRAVQLRAVVHRRDELRLFLRVHARRRGLDDLALLARGARADRLAVGALARNERVLARLHELRQAAEEALEELGILHALRAELLDLRAGDPALALRLADHRVDVGRAGAEFEPLEARAILLDALALDAERVEGAEELLDRALAPGDLTAEANEALRGVERAAASAVERLLFLLGGRRSGRGLGRGRRAVGRLFLFLFVLF